VRGLPKYKITFNVSDLLKQFIPDAYCELVGFTDFEVTVTTSKTLKPIEIASIKEKLPFAEMMKIED